MGTGTGSRLIDVAAWFRRRLADPRLALMLALIFLLMASSSRAAPAVEQQPGLTIGVAQWRWEGGALADVQETTYLKLLSELEGLHLEGISVIRIDDILENADQVDSVAAKNDVDVVVWGWYDDVAVRGYVDLADATQDNGMTNSLSAFLERGGNTNVIRVLNVFGDFEYAVDGVSFCVPRWTP